MSQLLTTTDLSVALISGVAKLCDTPFTLEAVSAACEDNGWEILPLEDWEECERGDAFLRVKTPHSGWPLIAIWGDETIAGIPLAVIYEDDVTSGITEVTISEYNMIFENAKQAILTELESVSREGTYESDWHPFPLHFALFERKHSTLAVLQHDEGDGHLGNVASVDIRILPTSGIDLPLNTNLIF